MVEIEYAKAMHDLALEENKVDIFWDNFTIVGKTNDDINFKKLMSSPLIEKEKKKEIIKTIYKKLDDTFIDFLYVLIDHDRFNICDAIAHEYRKLVRIDKNIMFIDIISSEELNEKQIKFIKKMLEKKYNDKTLDYKLIVKPDLIGGIQIISNGVSIDMSLKASLNRIKGEL